MLAPMRLMRPQAYQAAYAAARLMRAHPRAVSTRAAAGSAQAVSSTDSRPQQRPPWAVRLLYDGECPLCLREVNFLRGKDAQTKKIDFVDISAADYNPADNANISYAEAMERIHAIMADGRILTNVDVFRTLYEMVGLGWVYAITKWEPAGRAANSLYGVWAKYRMEITGRDGSMAVILERRRAERAGRTGTLCDDTTGCEIPLKK